MANSTSSAITTRAVKVKMLDPMDDVAASAAASFMLVQYVESTSGCRSSMSLLP